MPKKETLKKKSASKKASKKKAKAELVCVIDKSGSMYSKVEDTIGGFNNFLKEQKKIGDDATVTLVLFDTKYDVVEDGIPINKMKNLTKKTYKPSGCTALLDAVGKAITTVDERIDKMPKSKRPKKVIVSILTDGQENSSREYKKKQIFDMITEYRKDKNWEFVFLGVDQDAFAEAGAIGIPRGTTINTTSADYFQGFVGFADTVKGLR